MIYKMSIHHTCTSFTGLDTFSHKTFTLKDKDEYEQVLKLCKDKKNMAGPFKASLIPIRTNFSSLDTDLLLPTLIHGVIKTKQASNVCFILLALLWDSVTLPLRFITLLPRVCYNAFVQPSEHPLIPYLREKGLTNPLDLDNEVVIRVFEETKLGDYSYGQIGFRYDLFLTNHEVPFVPRYYQLCAMRAAPEVGK